MLRFSPTLLLLLSLALLGCGEEPGTAIRLHLIASPQLNTETQVMTALDRIEFVFDSDSGFNNAPPAGQSVGPLVSRDVDADGTLELVLDAPVSDSERFPLYRLLPGTNLGHDFSIRAVGWTGSQAAAVGGAKAVTFTEGESVDVAVPLDLCDAHLPPRVLYTVPQEQETILEQDLPRFDEIRVYFSKRIDTATAAGNLRVVHDATGKTAPGEWKFQDIDSSCLGSAEKRTVAIFVLGQWCLLEGGSYSVQATSGLRDLQGTALDQTALQAGPNDFTSGFSIVRTTPVGICTGGTGPCETDADCEASDRCDLDPTSETFKTCIPRDTVGGACGATCPQGYVCDGNTHSCIRDCRDAGACIGPVSCDAKSGLCF